MNKNKLPLILIICIVFIGFSLLIGMMIIDTTDVVQENSLLVKYKHDRDHSENQNKLIFLEAYSKFGIKEITLNYKFPYGEFKNIPFTQYKNTPYFFAIIPGNKKGERSFFYITAIDNKGHKVILPKQKEKKKINYYQLKFEGKPSFILKLLHVMLMFTSLIILIHALYYSFSYLINKDENAIPKLKNLPFWWIIIFFITGFPIGWLIAWQTFGKAWTGIPFGWDITDNKTLLILIYWLGIFIPFKFKKLSPSIMAKLIIVGTIFTLALFIIPHSI
jgi:hypothetical protein